MKVARVGVEGGGSCWRQTRRGSRPSRRDTTPRSILWCLRRPICRRREQSFRELREEGLVLQRSERHANVERKDWTDGCGSHEKQLQRGVDLQNGQSRVRRRSDTIVPDLADLGWPHFR